MIKKIFTSLLMITVVACAGQLYRATAQQTGRLAVLNPAPDAAVQVNLPPDWRLLLPHKKCLEFAGAVKVCSQLVPPEEIGTCRWIEAAARFMDAPGDKKVSTLTTELKLSSADFKNACTALIKSPRQNSVYLRSAIEWNGRFLIFVSDPVSMKSIVYEARLQELQSGFDTIMKSLAPPGANEPIVPQQAQRPDFEQVKKQFPGVREHVRPDALIEADRLRLIGKIEEAARKYEALEKEYPYDRLIGLADIKMATMNLDAAGQLYEKARKLDPEKPDAYNGLGSIHLTKGDVGAAADMFAKANEKDALNPVTFVNQGWLALSKGDWTGAETLFMSALANVPELDGAVAATNGLTEISLHYGEYASTVAWNVSLLKKFPDYPEAYANLVRAYLALGRSGEALKAAKLLEQLLPGVPGANILAGRAYYSSALYEQAAEKLCPFVKNSTVTLSQEDLLFCADSLIRNAQTATAIEVLRGAIESNDVIPEYYILLARANSEAGGDPAALATLQKGLEKFPGNESIKAAVQQYK